MSGEKRRKVARPIEVQNPPEERNEVCNSFRKADSVVITNKKVVVNLAILFVQIAHHLREVCRPSPHDLEKVETWFRYRNVQKDRARIGYQVNCLPSK